MEEMTKEEIRQALLQNNVGHLGMSKGKETYVVPVFFGFDGTTLYFHSHPGTKDQFIASDHEACLAVTKLPTSDEWESVLAFGPIEKVQVADELRKAMAALITVPLPAEWGFTESGEPKRSGANMYFWKLTPRRITGRKSRRAATDEDVDMG